MSQYSFDYSLGRLVGKRVAAVEVATTERARDSILGDPEYISFVLDDGERLVYSCEGDCCSYSFIQHINGLAALIGNEVLEEPDEPNENAASVAEADADHELAVYFFTVRTAAGCFDIEMRNESNGYYGGSLIYVKPDCVPGDLAWKQVTEDF